MHNKRFKRILIACEFAVLVRGLKLIIEQEEGLQIIGEANNVNEIFNILHETVPDIIMVNLNLDANSIDSLCKNVHDKYPNLPILLLLKDSMEIALAELIVNGVRGVLWENDSEHDLNDVIRCVANGSLFFEDPKNCKLNCHMSHKICDNSGVDNLSHVLSEREVEVLKLIAKGWSYKKIAELLFISSRTVESHKNNIMIKLNIKNKNDLIRYSIENLNM